MERDYPTWETWQETRLTLRERVGGNFFVLLLSHTALLVVAFVAGWLGKQPGEVGEGSSGSLSNWNWRS